MDLGQFDPVKNPELFALDTRKSTIVLVNTTLLIFTTILVILRFYTRAVVLHTVGADDWLVLLSLIFFAALVGSEFVMETKGLGHHIGTLPRPDGFKEFLKAFFVSIQLYNAAIASIKFAFLAQYFRIMTNTNMKRTVLVVTAIVGSWCISQMMMSIFTCSPVSGFWDPGPGTVCLPELPVWYANAVGNIIADIMIILLPLPMIRKLKLPLTQKLVLAGIFCLGFFTCAISASRIRFLGKPVDATYDMLDAEFWSLAEICSGITCAVLPTLRPLAGKWFPRYFGSRSGGSYFLSRATGSAWQQKDYRTSQMRSQTARKSVVGLGSRKATDHDDEERMRPSTKGELVSIPEQHASYDGRDDEVMEMHGMAAPVRSPAYPHTVYTRPANVGSGGVPGRSMSASSQGGLSPAQRAPPRPGHHASPSLERAVKNDFGAEQHPRPI